MLYAVCPLGVTPIFIIQVTPTHDSRLNIQYRTEFWNYVSSKLVYTCTISQQGIEGRGNVSEDLVVWYYFYQLKIQIFSYKCCQRS